MSQIYVLEPPTQGKVVLRTSLGDLDVELWPKEAPRAVRNFVQLCLEGYYDGTVFHRVIKDFMIQGGDPTGTGDGGASIYGRPFKDEFHSRLKFNHRGLIACANANAPNTNGSQFFITLDKAPHLDRQATIFGKITGETIYNLSRFNDVETKDDDRPAEPPVLRRADVLWNPFEDIKPRIDRSAKEAAAAAAAKAAHVGHETKRGGQTGRAPARNLKLVSFGDEAQEEEAEIVAAGPLMQSAHDALNDTRLSKEAAVEVGLARVKEAMRAARQAGAGPEPADFGVGTDLGQRKEAVLAGAELDGATLKHEEEEEDRNEEDFAAKMRERVDKTKRRRDAVGRVLAEGDEQEEGPPSHPGRGGIPTPTIGVAELSPKRRKRDRMDGLARDSKATAAIVAPSKQLRVQDRDLLTNWEARRAEYKERKRLGGRRETDTMTKLEGFLNKMRAGTQDVGETNAVEQKSKVRESRDEEKTRESSGSKIAKKTEEGYAGHVDAKQDHRAYMPAAWRVDSYVEGTAAEDDGIGALRRHRLQFKGGGGDGAQENGMLRKEDVDDYVVMDPLLEKGKAKFNKQRQREKKRETEWGRGRRGQ
jgi:peptidyl-prolyl cis-trans isomerase SDCCAG10